MVMSELLKNIIDFVFFEYNNPVPSFLGTPAEIINNLDLTMISCLLIRICDSFILMQYADSEKTKGLIIL